MPCKNNRIDSTWYVIHSMFNPQWSKLFYHHHTSSRVVPWMYTTLHVRVLWLQSSTKISNRYPLIIMNLPSMRTPSLAKFLKFSGCHVSSILIGPTRGYKVDKEGSIDPLQFNEANKFLASLGYLSVSVNVRAPPHSLRVVARNFQRIGWCVRYSYQA